MATATGVYSFKGWKKPDNVAGSSAPAIMVGCFVSITRLDRTICDLEYLGAGLDVVIGQALSRWFAWNW